MEKEVVGNKFLCSNSRALGCREVCMCCSVQSARPEWGVWGDL